jgi:hypothetical protein
MRILPNNKSSPVASDLWDTLCIYIYMYIHTARNLEIKTSDPSKYKFMLYVRFINVCGTNRGVCCLTFFLLMSKLLSCCSYYHCHLISLAAALHSKQLAMSPPPLTFTKMFPMMITGSSVTVIVPHYKISSLMNCI